MTNAQFDFTPKLQYLIQQRGITSLKALSRLSGVSERQILRLRRGEVESMRVETLNRLSNILQISLNELVSTFSQPISNQLSVERERTAVSNQDELLQKIAVLNHEYIILQEKFQQQREQLQQHFQQETINLLESLLLQFPTAAYKARENSQLPAVNILPLVQNPIEKLLQAWGIEKIASVGAEIVYEPQFHQLMDGIAQPGELVKVRNIGYRQGDKLLYRAKVSGINRE